MKQTDDKSDAKWVEQAKREFDESVDSLDAATLSRLNRGRQAALEAAKRRRTQWTTLLPLTGLAAALVVAIMVTRVPEVDELAAPMAAISDFEILLGDEDIDMLEDLEFYSWLDTVDLDEDGDVG